MILVRQCKYESTAGKPVNIVFTMVSDIWYYNAFQQYLNFHLGCNDVVPNCVKHIELCDDPFFKTYAEAAPKYL